MNSKQKLKVGDICYPSDCFFKSCTGYSTRYKIKKDTKLKIHRVTMGCDIVVVEFSFNGKKIRDNWSSLYLNLIRRGHPLTRIFENASQQY